MWEIVIGAHNHFIKEESLVTLSLEDNVDCDVIGDVHGNGSVSFMQHLFLTCVFRAIL